MKKSFLTSFRKLGGRGFRVFSAQSGLKIEGVQDIIAVASGKGGVGKSTTADFGNPREMSFFKCPHCGEPWHIFGKGGARRTADEMGLPFLGEIPLEADIRKCSDEGVPVVLSNPDSAVSKAYSDVAQKVVSRLQELSEQQFLLPEINLWSYILRSQL